MSRLLFVVAVMSLPVLALADAPTGQYTITDGGTPKGTVYDKKTKLTWQQAVTTTRYDWEGAKTYCAQEAGKLLGGSGWRLPTLKELVSIVDYSRQSPAIDTTAFPSMSADSYIYWSSSPCASLASSSTSAWRVDFGVGYLSSYPFSEPASVRCVR